MTTLPLHHMLPAISRLDVVSDNARSPVYAQSFAKRPKLKKHDQKAKSRWSSTVEPRLKQQNMPTLMSSRDEHFVKNDSDVDKRFALHAQAIRIPVRQSSRIDMLESSSLRQKKIVGDSAPVSSLFIPVRQFGSQCHQPDKSQGLRIPIRQMSQQCLVKESDQAKERKNLNNSKKTTELLSQVLEDLAHIPIDENAYRVDPFFI